MNDTIKTIDYNGHTIEICPDYDAESPREWDNLGTIYSNRLNVKPDGLSIDDLLEELGYQQFPGFDALMKRMQRDYIAYRVCMVDHSMIKLSLNTPAPNPYMGFDSGTFGIIAVRRDKVRKEYGVKRIDKALRNKVTTYLEGELETYEAYLNGWVYGYVIDGGVSCWGFYDMDYCIEEAKRTIDCMTKLTA